MSFETVMAVVGLAVSVGGLALAMRPEAPRGRTAALVVVVALLLLSSAVLLEQWQKRREVDRIKESITRFLSTNRPASFQQILESLNHVEYGLAEQAIDELTDSNQINSRIVDLRSESTGRVHPVQMYNNRNFPVH